MLQSVEFIDETHSLAEFKVDATVVSVDTTVVSVDTTVVSVDTTAVSVDVTVVSVDDECIGCDNEFVVVDPVCAIDEDEEIKLTVSNAFVGLKFVLLKLDFFAFCLPHKVAE